MIAPSTSSMETQAKLVVESPFSNLSSSIVSTLDNSLKQFSHRSSLRFQTLATRRRISLSAAATTPGPSPIQDEHRKPPDLQTLMRRFWKVAVPYWSSDDKVQARLQLAAVFALTLGTTGITVGFSFLGRDFYNALANKDQQQFTKQLLYYLAGFAGGIPFFVLRDYAREKLSLRWRSWMTSYYMDRYLKNKTFYKIQSQSTIDNPDQRIVDDLSSFTGTALSFSLTLFNAAIDLISFSNILYGIFPPLFVVLLAYSLGGTAISIFLGRQLLISSRNLEFFTNGYRYLIQILPAAVVAPMYFSGKVEFGVINQSVSAFNHILGDFSLIVYQFQAISAFSAVIDRLGEFDDVLDSSNGKGHRDSKEEIQLSFCLISCSNGLDSNGSMPLSKRVKLLHVEHLTVQTPSEATLIKDLSFEIFEKDHLLVTGPSGSGKTSLLRAVAGLWSFGNGAITVYVRAGGDLDIPHSADVVSHQVASINETVGNSTGRRNSEGVIFLPQKPYMVLGTLRQQLLYPIWTEDPDNLSDGAKQSDSLPFLTHARDARCVNEKPKKPTSDDLIQVLNDVSLGHLLSRFDGLDSTHEWSSVLSLGEQQRLAFGRLLLSKPTLALLDESTSALDEANEARLYQLIQAAGITYISIGHRRTLYKYHKKVLHVYTADRTTAQHNWSFKDVEEDPKYNFSWQ
ncbi:ABC transporter D family member 2, chloroplastic isoform X2 [Capsicum annuum]|uniref:ABC transporter D family member 2, chloroplastic isoform X2 n=1 Tax=Capsicum annuum TaxID=4072 RepID=UPI001FB14521|nr:ABC transporter D family member 2, chloroplastic isoform X2 [Capsicum annuum]